MKTKNKNFIGTVLIGILFFVAIVYSTILFYNTVNYELENSIRGTLVDMADQQQISVNRQLDGMVSNLTNMAETISVIGDQEEILEYTRNKQELFGFETVLIIDSGGSAFSSTKEILDVSQTDYFQAAITGDTYATPPHLSPYVDKEVLTVAVPIYSDNEITGVLAVEYNTDYIDALLTSFTNERGLNLIVDQDSTILFTTNEYVISFEAFKNAKFEEEITFEKVVADFRDGNSGSISYTLNGVKKLGEFRPIEINDWMLFFEISEDSVITSTTNISSRMIIISSVIIAFAFAVIVYIVLSKNKSAKILEQAAYFDELTGIPNLLKFKILVSEAIKKNPNTHYTMVKMDIENFKAVNELFGFEEGNRVIQAIADTGKTVTDPSFIQARVSSEEFMLFSDSKLFEHLDKSSKDFEDMFKQMIPHLKDHHFKFRYGRYFLEPGETDVNAIVAKTNIAHSFAKSDALHNIWNYDKAFTQKVLHDTEIANKMRQALESKEFKVYLQPKFCLTTNQISGAEALVRWVDSSGAIISPADFIPLFEQNGFIVELDKYMLQGVCETLASWKKCQKDYLPISVNFSRLHLLNQGFVQELNDIVSSYGVEPKYIEIELTESTILQNENDLKIILTQLHESGFLVSIDDFGSGYSSLGMLKTFKVDTLKLDRSFFIDTDNTKENQRGDLVVEGIIALANKLGINTIAEGIEEKHQVEFLKKINCKAVQGYYFAKPMPIDEFERFYSDTSKKTTH